MMVLLVAGDTRRLPSADQLWLLLHWLPGREEEGEGKAEGKRMLMGIERKRRCIFVQFM